MGTGVFSSPVSVWDNGVELTEEEVAEEWIRRREQEDEWLEEQYAEDMRRHEEKVRAPERERDRLRAAGVKLVDHFWKVP